MNRWLQHGSSWMREHLSAIPVRRLPPVPLILLVGLLISLLLVARSQVSGDQLNMLARGWLFTQGEWVHIGMTTSANGKAPGGALSLLAGVPLLLWADFRALALLVALAHLAGFLLLDQLLRRHLGEVERRLFALAYWLGPWRLLYSGFVWNANLLPFFGAAHLATSFAMRQRRRFAATLVHVLALGICVQVHAAAVMLALLSLILLMTRTIRVHWGGALVGAALVGASLIPWLEEVIANPELLPAGKGFPFRGLVFVFPLLRGLLLWVRFPSLFITSRMQSYDFTALAGEVADAVLSPLALGAAWLVGIASLALPVLVLTWFVKRFRRFRFWPAQEPSQRSWLLRYVQLTFAASALSFAASPTTPMMWQGFAILPAVVLALVLWAGVISRSRWSALVPPVAALWLGGALLVSLLAAAAAPMYRQGGRHPITTTLAQDHPMLHQLKILERTSVQVREGGRFTPDVFLPNPAHGR